MQTTTSYYILRHNSRCGGALRITRSQFVRAIPCPACNQPLNAINALRIWGQVNESKPCGGACLAAKGPDCECQCGGENHGSRYGA